MICEKCLHEEVCDQSSRQMWSVMAGEKECSDFKDRTKYAEVVQCKDCKYRGDVSCPMYSEEYIEWDDGDGYHDSDYVAHDQTHDEGFCDRGERGINNAAD